MTDTPVGDDVVTIDDGDVVLDAVPGEASTPVPPVPPVPLVATAAKGSAAGASAGSC